MGCFLSTPKQSNLPLSTQEFPSASKSPPRPEEESVKEVLSETPKPIPGFRNLESEEEKGPTKPKILLTRPLLKLGSPDPTPDEISDSVSLSLSLTESISNTTPQETEEVDVHQWSGGGGKHSGQMRFRSQGQNGNNFIRNRSPVKRAVEPRRNPVQRREAGENSGRRSRSPGNRGNVGRSPSGRRNGPSPGRVRMGPGSDPNENVRKMEESEREWQGPNESLENPLVSLECFIFL